MKWVERVERGLDDLKTMFPRSRIVLVVGGPRATTCGKGKKKCQEARSLKGG